MPTYEYRCPNGHDFDKFFRTISASEPEVPCPTCGAMAVRQVSAGAGLLFKGSGFYLTDYGKNAHASRGPAPAAKPGAGSDKSSGGDSAAAKPAAEKPAAASETKSSGGTKSGAANSTPKKGD